MGGKSRAGRTRSAMAKRIIHVEKGISTTYVWSVINICNEFLHGNSQTSIIFSPNLSDKWKNWIYWLLQSKMNLPLRYSEKGKDFGSIGVGGNGVVGWTKRSRYYKNYYNRTTNNLDKYLQGPKIQDHCHRCSHSRNKSKRMISSCCTEDLCFKLMSTCRSWKSWKGSGIRYKYFIIFSFRFFSSLPFYHNVSTQQFGAEPLQLETQRSQQTYTLQLQKWCSRMEVAHWKKEKSY